MYKVLLKQIQQFKWKSKFVSTLLTMILLCFIMCFVFSGLLANFMIKNTLQYAIQNNQSYINMVAENTNYLINQMHQSMTQLTYTKSILSTTLSSKYKDSNKNLVTTDLALTDKYNPLIDSAFLYIPRQNCIYTSTYHSYSLGEYPDSSLITAYESNTISSSSYEDAGKITSIFFYDGDLVLARDFPLYGAKKLGTLFYTVDTNELYKRLTTERNNGTHIWVYDANDNPIFVQRIDYPNESVENTLNLFRSEEKEYLQLDHSVILHATSNTLGWQFLYTVDESILMPTLQSIIFILLPIILIILVISFIISLFIAFDLYRPVQKLLNTVESDRNSSMTNISPKNEFDYLNYAFSQITGRQSELNTVIKNVSHDIMSRFFLDLLSGEQKNLEIASDILKQTQSPFQINSFYIVSILQCKGDFSILEHQRQIILSELYSIMETFNANNNSCSHILVIDGMTFAVILSFDKSNSLFEIIKGLKTHLEPEIDKLTQKYDLPLQFRIGNPYYSILDVGFSYSEAMKALSNPKEAIPADHPGQEDTYVGNLNMEQRAQQVLDFVLYNDIKSARVLSDRIINEINENETNTTLQLENNKAFLAAFTNKITSMNYINLSSIPNDLLLLNDMQFNDTDISAFTEKVKDVCLKLINELSKSIKKQQNHYILKAQEYIAKHYSNSNLSLNLIAEEIDMNPSYLSKLFKDNLGTNFNDYLNHYRIEKSIPVLTTGTDSINDIALQFGYNSVQNYIRVFKKYTGVTPGQYRKNSEK